MVVIFRFFGTEMSVGLSSTPSSWAISRIRSER
jgi:hypothetical protein